MIWEGLGVGETKGILYKSCSELSILVQCVYLGTEQRYTYRNLQTIQMKLILLCVWAEPAILGSAKTPFFKYEI